MRTDPMQWSQLNQSSYYYHRRETEAGEGTHYPGPVGSGVGKILRLDQRLFCLPPGRETQSELIQNSLLHFRAFIWACSRPSKKLGVWLLRNIGQPSASCCPPTPPPASLSQPPLPVVKGGSLESYIRHLL